MRYSPFLHGDLCTNMSYYGDTSYNDLSNVCLFICLSVCLFVCLFPYSSQVLGPIFTKLGGKVEGGPGY